MIISGLDQPAPAAPADIHVSIGGDDANDGSAALYSRVGSDILTSIWNNHPEKELS